MKLQFLPWVQNTGSTSGGCLAKEGLKYHLSAPLIHPRGNLFYQEHQADHTYLCLILLENCQVEPLWGHKTSCLYHYGVESIQGGQAYKLAAENQ